jgi:hypothetical protein
MLAGLCFTWTVLAGTMIPFDGEFTDGFGDTYVDSVAVGESLTPAFAGQWQLTWDDQIGQELTGDTKTCDIMFRVVDGTVDGRFVGPVANSERDEIIDGRLHNSASGRLLTFAQREAGYVCSYQIFWSNSAEDLSKVVGVWHDTKGRSGNFTLRKYQ